MEKYNKLVRDNIPDILDKKNIPYEKRIASESEYKTELIKKLDEEMKEFSIEGSPEELADILEVVEALKTLPEYETVEKIKKEKRKEKGGFEKRIILQGEK
ncbi:MAG: nucleoside triphosphate pyrophosphohydrolase [Patescibacteria group bacterium]